MATSKTVTPLEGLLEWKRPMGSRTERRWISREILPRLPTGWDMDRWGNIWAEIPGNPSVLWTAHTDTVHRTEGRQRLREERGILSPHPGEKVKECLGADDGTGVWLLLSMITAGVPGRYVFCYGEEHGLIGSGAVARKEPHRLDGVRHTISLDRRGCEDIVTHQMGTRMGSDPTARAIADRLGLPLSPAHGSYTDSAAFGEQLLGGECFNVAVGYDAQHTPYETQDLAYAYDLRDRLISADWTDLPGGEPPVDDSPYGANVCLWCGEPGAEKGSVLCCLCREWAVDQGWDPRDV